MRDIVQRDLTYLLNTANIEDQIDREQYPEIAASTLNFGVPSLAGGYSTARQWRDIEQNIRRAILDFEPRLMPETLAVTPLTDINQRVLYNVLPFEVSGKIRMDPYPLEFLVQSTLDLETNHVRMEV
jgi:type VI secretion system protein ImpF